MQVRVEEVSEVEKKLLVEVPWDTVNVKLGEAYKELARGVSLKGFRKGKVPKTVLQRMFGKRIKAEVASQLVRESFLSAATEHNLQAVSEPRVDQELVIKKGEPFAFEAVVEVRGEVAAPEYADIEIRKRILKIEDDEIDAALKKLQEEHMELLPIEGRDITGRTDVLTISCTGTIGDNDIDRPSLHMDLSDEGGTLPGLVAALRGIPLDTKDHDITLEFPEDYHDKDLAGKSANLTISIVDARHKQLPELDDEFAKDTEKADTLDELKASIKSDIEKGKEDEIKRELRDQALKKLVEANQIPIAPALIDRAAEMKFRRLQSMLGINPDAPGAAGADFGLTDEMREKLRPQAADEVRGQLLLEALADEQKLEVEESELEEFITGLAESQGSTPARLRAELEHEHRLDSIRFQLRQDKTLDHIIAAAKITEYDPADEPAASDDDDPATDADSEEAADTSAADE